MASIKIKSHEICSMAHFLRELSNHYYDAHYYLKDLHIMAQSVDPDLKERVLDSIFGLTELLSLIQLERENIAAVGDKMQRHTDIHGI